MPAGTASTPARTRAPATLERLRSAAAAAAALAASAAADAAAAEAARAAGASNAEEEDRVSPVRIRLPPSSGTGGAGGGGYDASGYPAPVFTIHTVRDRFLQQEAAGAYHRGPRCDGYVAPAPTTSGSYGYYPTPFYPFTANFTSHFAGSENLAGGGGRNANEAVILNRAAACLGTVKNGLLELEAAIRGQLVNPADTAHGVAGLRTSVYQTWVFFTTRYEVLFLMRHQHDYAMDLARVILSPRDSGMGGVATAPYHHAAAVAQATTIARDQASRATRAMPAGDGSGDGGRGRARRRGTWRGSKRPRDAGDADNFESRGRGRGRGK